MDGLLARPFLRGALTLPPSTACLSCQWRSFSTSYRRKVEKTEPQETKAAPKRKRTPVIGFLGPSPNDLPPTAAQSRWVDTPSSWGKSFKGETFTPEPLQRPIGMNYPPEPGQNSGVKESRTLQQRKEDFMDPDKFEKKQLALAAQWRRPAFRDWTNMKFSQGKAFLPPPRLFKADRSLYFPNFRGWTLAKTGERMRDTTNAIAGKASIVSLFGSSWGSEQTSSFTSEKEHPALHELLKGSNGQAQTVSVAVEEDLLKSWIVWLAAGSLRRSVGREDWDKYFVVHKGVSNEIRESVGLLNSKVGYTYLVDHQCRIRWAASGPATDEERAGLVKGLQRLLTEMSQVDVPSAATQAA